MPISRTSKRNENWFEKSLVREIREGGTQGKIAVFKYLSEASPRETGEFWFEKSGVHCIKTESEKHFSSSLCDIIMLT